MTAAERLRELLATRPPLPNLEELSRWWVVSSSLVPQVLDLARELGKEVDRLAREKAEAVTDLITAHRAIAGHAAEMARLDLELARVKALGYDAAPLPPLPPEEQLREVGRCYASGVQVGLRAAPAIGEAIALAYVRGFEAGTIGAAIQCPSPSDGGNEVPRG